MNALHAVSWLVFVAGALSLLVGILDALGRPISNRDLGVYFVFSGLLLVDSWWPLIACGALTEALDLGIIHAMSGW